MISESELNNDPGSRGQGGGEQRKVTEPNDCKAYLNEQLESFQRFAAEWAADDKSQLNAELAKDLNETLVALQKDLEESNKRAADKFEKAMSDIAAERKGGMPESILERMEKSAKQDLSIVFNSSKRSLENFIKRFLK